MGAIFGERFRASGHFGRRQTIGGDTLAQNILPEGSDEDADVVVYDEEDDDVDPQLHQCREVKRLAEHLWSDEGQDEAQLSWRSSALASAMNLVMVESELEIVSAEREQLLNNFSSKEEYLLALGVGFPRNFNDFSASVNDQNGYWDRHIGATSLRGYHAQSEDFTIALDTFGMTALAVFDGHGGDQVSHAVAHAMLRWLPTQWLQMMRRPHFIFDEFWHQSLRAGFQCAQDLLKKSIDPNLLVGSTGIVVVADKLVGSRQLDITALVAWAGDSQLLHARHTDGEWKMRHTTPGHDCENDKLWKKMVERTIANESVSKDYEPRICDSRDGKPFTRYGPLNKKVGVTRAFGDFNFVENGVVVGPAPTIEKLKLRPGDLLILASDGLWDAFDPEQVMAEINKVAKSNEFPINACRLGPPMLSAHLAALAKTGFWDSKGYQDDISVLVWCVPDPSDASHAASFFDNAEIAPAWLQGGIIGDRCQVIQERSGITFTQHSTCERVSTSDFRTHDPDGIRLKCYNPDGTRPQANEFGFCAIPRKRPCHKDKFKNGGCHTGLICRDSSSGSFCDHDHGNDSRPLSMSNMSMEQLHKMALQSNDLAVLQQLSQLGF